MKKILFLVLLSLAGGFVVRQLLQGDQRERLAHLPATVMAKCMEICMEMLPEDSPPKVFVSSMSRLQEQIEQLLALQQERNDLLRERLPAQEARSPESPSNSRHHWLGHPLHHVPINVHHGCEIARYC